MGKSQRSFFLCIAVALVVYPLVQSFWFSQVAGIRQLVALIGVLIAVLILRRMRAPGEKRFTWPWVMASGALGSVVLSTVTVLFFPYLGVVRAYRVSHGNVPDAIAAQRTAFDMAGAVGLGVGCGLLFSLALCSFLYALERLDPRRPAVEPIRFGRRKT